MSPEFSSQPSGTLDDAHVRYGEFDVTIEERHISHYEDACIEAGIKAMEYGVDYNDFCKAMELVEGLRECGDNDTTATHCLNVGLLSAEYAAVTGADQGEALIAGMLHDVFKKFVERRALLKSVDGTQGWDIDDIQAMAPHALGGALMAAEAGFNPRIVYALAQHHAYQERFPVDNHEYMMHYFADLYPDGQVPDGTKELLAALVDADSCHARWSRINSFDADMTAEGKKEGAKANIYYIHQAIGLDNADEKAAQIGQIADRTIHKYLKVA